MRWSCCCCFFSKTSVIHATPPPSYSSTDATYIRIQSKKQKKKELDRTIYGGAAEHQIPDFRSDAWYLNRSTIKNGNFSYFAHRLINFDMNLWLDFDAAIEKRYRWCRTIDLLSLSLSLWLSFLQIRFTFVRCVVLLLHKYDDIGVYAVYIWFSFTSNWAHAKCKIWIVV